MRIPSEQRDEELWNFVSEFLVPGSASIGTLGTYYPWD